MKSIKSNWRNKPITDKQIAIMEQFSIPFDNNMTRGEASAAITEFQETADHIFSEEAFHE